MPEGLPKLELIAWVEQRYSIRRSQARRELDWLEKRGYIAALADERDRRIKRVRRTGAGRKRLDSWTRIGTPFDFLKGLAIRASAAASEPAPAGDPEPEPMPRPKPTPRASRPTRTSIGEELAAERAEMLRRERSLI